jgi:hypothetical protein
VLLVEVALLLLELSCAVASGSVLGGGGVGLALLGVPGVLWSVALLDGVAEFMLLFVVSAGGVVVEVPVWPALWSVVEFVVDEGCAD